MDLFFENNIDPILVDRVMDLLDVRKNVLQLT